MRLVSKIFQPVITIPKNAKIKNTEVTCKSQKLLLECGLVRPTGAGLFAVLPLGWRALRKLEGLARACVESVGAQPVVLPSLTSAGLWETTGRLQDIGSELMVVEDRHHKKYVLAPTHEEAITELLADVSPISYKQLPLLLYQISEKYRDELRPKHGVLRARSFRMLDAYGFTGDAGGAGGARALYGDVTAAYRRLFAALALRVHRVEAPTGDMGGTFSHEWQLCAEAGEDAIDVCLSCSHARLAGREGGRACEQCGGEVETRSSIEVGHTFALGERYSAPLLAHCTPPQPQPPRPLYMTCYGIGLTRLLAASLEALSSDTALRWPEAIAPFSTIIIGPKEGSKEWSSHGWERVQQLHERLSSAGRGRGRGRALGGDSDVLVDDRHHLTIGKRLMMADRMGYPTIIVCGKSTLESPAKYEVYRTLPKGESQTQLLSIEELVQMFSDGGEVEINVNNKISVDNKV